MSQILELAGFKLQVLGYEFANPDNVWDADWLNVTCSSTTDGSSVKFTGPYVTNAELHQLLTIMKNLHSGAFKTGELDCTEPELNLSFIMEPAGHLRFTVNLTPDYRSQSHRATFDIAQIDLLNAIGQCSDILESYPVRSIPTSTE